MEQDEDTYFGSCAVCFDSYDEADHLPRLLSCGHTFCHQCLDSLCRTKKKKSQPTASEESGAAAVCPKCRHPTPLSHGSRGASSLPRNFELLDLLSRSSKQEEGNEDHHHQQKQQRRARAVQARAEAAISKLDRSRSATEALAADERRSAAAARAAMARTFERLRAAMAQRERELDERLRSWEADRERVVAEELDRLARASQRLHAMSCRAQSASSEKEEKEEEEEEEEEETTRRAQEMCALMDEDGSAILKRASVEFLAPEEDQLAWAITSLGSLRLSLSEPRRDEEEERSTASASVTITASSCQLESEGKKEKEEEKVCTNAGCGERFVESANNTFACTYHPGQVSRSPFVGLVYRELWTFNNSLPSVLSQLVRASPFIVCHIAGS